MSVVFDYPPNYQEICQRFDLKGKSPVFTYGNTIYNPGKHELSPELIVHEQTHMLQQKDLGPEKWWECYLRDDGFRMMQELEAYRAQWKASQNRPRAYRRSLLAHIVRDLGGRMYGNLMTKEEAKKLLTGES